MREDSTYSSDLHGATCPYCGATNRLNDLYGDLNGPEAADVECRECEKSFRALFHVSISVTCERRVPQ